MYSQLKIHFFPWICWVVHLLGGGVEDGRLILILVELLPLERTEKTSFPHISVSDDHQLPHVFDFSCRHHQEQLAL